MVKVSSRSVICSAATSRVITLATEAGYSTASASLAATTVWSVTSTSTALAAFSSSPSATVCAVGSGYTITRGFAGCTSAWETGGALLRRLCCPAVVQPGDRGTATASTIAASTASSMARCRRRNRRLRRARRRRRCSGVSGVLGCTGTRFPPLLLRSSFLSACSPQAIPPPQHPAQRTKAASGQSRRLPLYMVYAQYRFFSRISRRSAPSA